MEKRVIWHCATMCHDNWYMLVVVDFVLTRKRLACMFGVLLRECTNKCLASGSSWSGCYTSFLTDLLIINIFNWIFSQGSLVIDNRRIQNFLWDTISGHRERQWHCLTISSVRVGRCKVKLGLWATAFSGRKVKSEILYIWRLLNLDINVNI